MEDIKIIRRKLWNSLDMFCVRKYLIEPLMLYAVALLMMLRQLPSEYRLGIAFVLFCILVLPVLLFCLWRSYSIFQKSGSYCFYRAVLDRPKAGLLRDTMYFTVVLDRKYVVDTHSIFQIRSLFGPELECYVNQTVTVAYNEETGSVVVIG